MQMGGDHIEFLLYSIVLLIEILPLNLIELDKIQKHY